MYLSEGVEAFPFEAKQPARVFGAVFAHRFIQPLN
jgi:hypothetical protein